jgi:hypothetical protein
MHRLGNRIEPTRFGRASHNRDLEILPSMSEASLP